MKPIRIYVAFLAILASASVHGSGFTLETNDNGEIVIAGCPGASGLLAIPDQTNSRYVTTIKTLAFNWKSYITQVTMGSHVTVIGLGAFENCGRLTSVSLSSNLTSIPDCLFEADDALRSLVIPDSVTNIGSQALMFCSSLTNVVVGRKVARIGDYAFLYCTNSMTIFFRGNAPTFGATTFFAVTNATAYYLPGTTGWDNFALSSTLPTVLWNPQPQMNDGSFGVRSNCFGFNITGNTNIPIVVEAGTNLGGAWTALQSASLTNGSFYFTDPQWTNYPNRFYRIRSP